MEKIGISDLKANFSTLVQKAATGDAFIITKAGRPVAKVLPVEMDDLSANRKRRHTTGAAEDIEPTVRIDE
jgi:prevent-host-death family protein